MRTKSIVLLVLALGCGLVASIGISQIIEQNKNAPAASVETEAILVAMKPIAGQEQLKAENVKLEQWPKNLIPKGALTKIEEVDGRRIKYSIAPGEPILQNKLVGEHDKRPTIDVPPGYRLAAVHADAVSAVGNLIQPGDRVDILVYLKAFKGGAQTVGTSTILQDIKVFAVNDQWRPNDDKGSDTVAAKNVTLLVTPEQAEKLTLATELGKVRLVLRSPDDNLKTDVGQGITPSDLFTNGESHNLDDEKDFLAKSGSHDTKKGNGLLGMLGIGSKESAAPQPETLASAPIDAQEHFSMELLEGPQSRTVEFTRPQGGKTKWQTIDGGAARGGRGGEVPNLTLPEPQGAPPAGFDPLNPLRPGDSVSLGPPAEKD
jgi:pilus assembly protein CpaB